MAKKTSVKVRLVPEAKPDSPFFYYVKKPSSGEKAKVKLKVPNSEKPITVHIEGISQDVYNNIRKNFNYF